MSEIQSAIHTAQELAAHEQYHFTPATLAAMVNIPLEQAYRQAARLKTAGLAISAGRGHYLLVGLEPARLLSNPLFIASHLAEPAYISYWSALHFHGLTTQAPQTVFCAVTRKKRPLTFHNHIFRYVLLKPYKFFGYQREQIDQLPVLVADPAKALIDSLDQPRYAGGLPEIAQALQTALSELDLALLTDYAVRMADRSLSSRLGFLLEALGRPANDLPVSESPVALDPSRPRRGRFNARWRVVINHDPQQLFAEGIA